jgi:hypothetical protein
MVNDRLPNGPKPYFRVVCLNETPREIIRRTKSFVPLAAQLGEHRAPEAFSARADRLAGAAFYRLHVRPKEIDKVLEVVEDDQIAIGWSEAASLVSPEVEESEFPPAKYGKCGNDNAQHLSRK